MEQEKNYVVLTVSYSDTSGGVHYKTGEELKANAKKKGMVYRILDLPEAVYYFGGLDCVPTVLIEIFDTDIEAVEICAGNRVESQYFKVDEVPTEIECAIEFLTSLDYVIKIMTIEEAEEFLKINKSGFNMYEAHMLVDDLLKNNISVIIKEPTKIDLRNFKINYVEGASVSYSMVSVDVNLDDKQFRYTDVIDKEGLLEEQCSALGDYESLTSEEDELLIENIQKVVNEYAELNGFISLKTKDEIYLVGYATELSPVTTSECTVLVHFDNYEERMMDDHVEEGDSVMSEEWFSNAEGVSYVVYEPYEKADFVNRSESEGEDNEAY